MTRTDAPRLRSSYVEAESLAARPFLILPACRETIC